MQQKEDYTVSLDMWIEQQELHVTVKSDRYGDSFEDDGCPIGPFDLTDHQVGDVGHFFNVVFDIARDFYSDFHQDMVREEKPVVIDLWPEDIQIVREKAPVAVLKEQATFLGQRTKNIVTAEVVPWGPDTSGFGFHFYIVGPAIGNYQYRLFTMWHDMEFYPLSLTLASGALGASPTQCITLHVDCQSEFIAALRRIFSNCKTLRVIQSILALSGVEPCH